LRENIKEASFIIFNISFLLDFLLSFSFLYTAVGTTIKIKQSNKARVTNIDEVGSMLSTFRI
jgi:hypothetical protein